MIDVIIVGAGPIGLACGIEAKKRGLNALIIEKGLLVNSIITPKTWPFFYLDRLEIGDIPYFYNPKPTRASAGILSSCHFNLGVKYQALWRSGTFWKTPKGLSLKRLKQLKKQNIVLSTGFYDLPYLLNVPGRFAQSVALLASLILLRNGLIVGVQFCSWRCIENLSQRR